MLTYKSDYHDSLLWTDRLWGFGRSGPKRAGRVGRPCGTVQQAASQGCPPWPTSEVISWKNAPWILPGAGIAGKWWRGSSSTRCATVPLLDTDSTPEWVEEFMSKRIGAVVGRVVRVEDVQ